MVLAKWYYTVRILVVVTAVLGRTKFWSKNRDNPGPRIIGVDSRALAVLHISRAYQILVSKTVDNRVPRLIEVLRSYCSILYIIKYTVYTH